MERHSERQKEITIKDVARRAGVAVSTVSRVLNDLDKVSEKTRQKVRAAVEELGLCAESAGCLHGDRADEDDYDDRPRFYQ